MQWAGLAIVAGGAVLIACSGQLPHVWMDRTAALLTDPLMGRQLRVDWLLLLGLMIAVGGGPLAQLTTEDHHE